MNIKTNNTVLGIDTNKKPLKPLSQSKWNKSLNRILSISEKASKLRENWSYEKPSNRIEFLAHEKSDTWGRVTNRDYIKAIMAYLDEQELKVKSTAKGE